MQVNALLTTVDSVLERRMLRTLASYAAGDAFGVAYEYLQVRVPVDPTSMGSRADWPHGGVSDDTLLSLLTIAAVEPGAPADSAERFLANLRRAVPQLRGLGPTTRAALGLPAPENEHLAVIGTTVIGNTNGGMMRTSLVGLGYPRERDDERRDMVAALARATHTAPSAVACAVLSSALFTAALEEPLETLSETLEREASALHDAPADVLDLVASLAVWTPPGRGIALDPVETLGAVAWVVTHSCDALGAFTLACELGGDTDTVAALAGALQAARSTDDEHLLSIPWIDEVLWSEIPGISTAAETLAKWRSGR